MSTQDHISGDILHDYCLGLLTAEERTMVEQICAKQPAVKSELMNIQQALEKYATEHPVWRKAAMKQRIWDVINNMTTEEQKDINNLPLINKYADHNNWIKIAGHLVPDVLDEDTSTTLLRATDKVTQLVIKSVIGHPEEIHNDIHESFLILEGECVCQIGDEFIEMKAGGYIEIPLYTKHNVKVLSPYIVAVVQRIAV